MNTNMDEKQHSIKKETCSLDIVEFDSSDDEFEFNESKNNHQINHADRFAIMGKEHQDGASSRHSVLKGDDEDDIDSEEERDLLKGIRDEIESKVRDEMKEELQMYKSKLLAIEDGKLPEDSNEAKAEANDTEQTEMDPKIKEAIVKMQKLDRILRKKVKREREVKRDRIILEKRLKDEIADMQHGATNYREIKMNTEKFLALAPPPSHNEGVTLDYEEEEDMPPLFQTQIDDCEIKRKSKRKGSMKDDSDKENGPNSENKTEGDESKSRSESSASEERSRNKNNKKNFIKRNMELAADANELIAMTEDEKQRIQDLLGDIDEMDEMGETADDGVESSIFQLALNPGDGFMPDDLELKSLTSIDAKLKNILPEDDFMSITGHSQYSTPRPALFTRVGFKSNLLDGFGEQVLYETKEERELKARLDSIEKKLEKFKSPSETETGGSDCHLSDDQLDNLLNQCARSISRTSAAIDTPDSTARSEVSSRLMLMENPPKLSNEQLQQLLSEAYFPMSSKLAALNEGSDDEGDDISAEAWKAIIDTRLDDVGDADDVKSNRDNQNISQNALSNNDKHCNGESYKYDNLLLSDKDEMFDHNSVNNFRDDPLPTRLRSQSKDFKGFPKISSSNTSKKTRGQGSASSSASANFNQGNSSTFKREDDPVTQASVDSLRLPNISSNSFLIHASQGLNNKSSSSRENPSARESIPMVRNNLSDMSLTSFNEENWDSHQNQEQRNSSSNLNPHRTPPNLVPKPPSTSH